ncbi:MAG: L-lactate permease [Thermacetogeniaceae bacterium]
MVLAVILTLLPIVVIFLLMTKFRAAADTSGVIGWILTLAIALLFFKTSLVTGFLASLTGIIQSFPVSLMVLTSLLQITFMEATGAIQRIAVFVKTFAASDQAVQIMLINMGAGTLLVAVGATPVSILPPILVALGYSTFIAVLLPAIGFDALCTFALLGAPLVAYSDLTGVTLVQAAQVFSRFLPVISTVIGFGMLWVVGRWDLIRKGWIPCLIAGVTNGCIALVMAYTPVLNQGVVLTGVVAGACTMLIMLLYLKILGKPIIDRSYLSEADLVVEQKMPLGIALSPWLILIPMLFIVAYWPWLHNILYTQWALPVAILPGQKPILTRMLWNAYTWVLISTILASIFLKPSGKAISETLTKWLRRAPRPVLSAAIFFAIALVMNNSGPYFVNVIQTAKGIVPNMIGVLALGSSHVFGRAYPFISAYLGLFGGFVSGSEASTIAMFAKYHILTSKMLGVDALIVTAATAIGAGLASVISPAKLQNAAATIDALGIESQVIKTALIVSVVMTLVAAVLALLLAL